MNASVAQGNLDNASGHPGEIRITVPVDPHDYSPNRRHARNPHAEVRIRREIKNRFIARARLAWHEAGEPKVDGPVVVTMLVRRGMVLDDDNARSGLKPVRDALFGGKRFERQGGAITRNDGKLCVQEWLIQWDTGKAWKDCPEVVFIIRPATPTAGTGRAGGEAGHV